MVTETDSERDARLLLASRSKPAYRAYHGLSKSQIMDVDAKALSRASKRLTDWTAAPTEPIARIAWLGTFVHQERVTVIVHEYSEEYRKAGGE